MRVLLVFILFLTSFLSLAQSKRLNELSIKIDNDAAFETDKYYSNGLEIMYQRRLAPTTKFRFGASHKIFTPEATFNTTVVEGDHPYTGLFYGILGVSHYNENFYLRADLWYGKQGPDAKAGVLQNLFHKMTPSSEVNGWENQTSNHSFFNGEFKLIKINQGQFFEMSPWIKGHYGGLLQDVEVGLKLAFRLGFLEFFINGSGVANFFNSVLEGSKDGDSVYVIASENMNDIYYKADAGFHLFFNAFRLTLKVNYYSAQFEEAKDHTYGTLETGFYF